MKNKKQFLAIIAALLLIAGCTAVKAPDDAPAKPTTTKPVDVTLTRMGEDKAAVELTPPIIFLKNWRKEQESRPNF